MFDCWVRGTEDTRIQYVVGKKGEKRREQLSRAQISEHRLNLSRS
jgi:hypothetical protein